MNKFIIICLNLVMMLSCTKLEEELEPSYLDTDRVKELIDLSFPLVEYLYNNHEVGLLYDFNDTLDFMYTTERYTIINNWSALEIDHLAAEDAEFAINFVDSSVFKYFKEEFTFNNVSYESGLIFEYLPFKILLSGEIGNQRIGVWEYLNESDSRASQDGIGVVHAVGNLHSFILAVDRPTVEASHELKVKYQRDHMYLLLSHIMDIHDLYGQIPPSFFDVSQNFYGRRIDSVYIEDGYNVNSANIIDKLWFLNKGFIDARYFYNGDIGLTTLSYDTLTIERGIKGSYSFIDTPEEFVRSYLNEIIHTDSTLLIQYPDIIQEKLVILMNELMNWGIDVVTLNPQLSVLYSEE